MNAPRTGVHSETGRLRTVIVHRPELSLTRLTPANKDDLLFDDILWVERAQQEHDAFVSMMRGRGIEVLYHQRLLAEALDTGPDARAEAVECAVTELTVGPGLVHEVRREMAGWSGERLAAHLIGGLTMEEFGIAPHRGGSLAAAGANPGDHLIRPLPNSFFQRDPAAWLYDGVTLNPMFWPARRLETFNQSLVYRHHPMFRDGGFAYWYPPGGDVARARPDFGRMSLEGGDLMPIGGRTVAVGIGERTSAQAVEHVALALFAAGAADRVIAAHLPRSRTCMHLDTVFTMLDVDKATAYPPAFERARVFSLRPGKRPGTLDVRSETDFFGAVRHALGLRELTVVPTGGDAARQAREQWDSGNNFVALEPGVVVGYSKNRYTNRRVREHGVEVIEIEGSELGKGRGGARCMTCPVARDGI